MAEEVAESSGRTSFTSDALYACLDISEEDEQQHPEAVACLKKIISMLGPNGVSPSVQAKTDAQLAEYNVERSKMRQNQLLLSTIKQVLSDQEMDGYDRLPEAVVEDMVHKMYLTELKLKLGDGTQQNSCIKNIFESITPADLTPEHKNTLIELIGEKFAKVPLDYKKVREDLDKSKQEYAEILVLLRKKRIEIDRLKQDNEEMTLKLTVVAKKELKKQEFDLEVNKLEREISILETRMHQCEVMRELYSGEKGEAIKILVSRNEEKVEAEKAIIKEKQSKLKLYTTLPEEFQNIVKNYTSVRKEIENAEWSLKKLQSDDDAK